MGRIKVLVARPSISREDMDIHLKGTAKDISSKATEDIHPSSKGTVMGLRKAEDMVGDMVVGGMEVGMDNHRGNHAAEDWERREERRWGWARAWSEAP